MKSSSILRSSDKSNFFIILIFFLFFIYFFFFCTYINLSKESSAKYCRGNKKDYKKRLVKDMKVILKKKKKKEHQNACEQYKNLREDGK